jgi:ATP-binding cassette subfamily B protein
MLVVWLTSIVAGEIALPLVLRHLIDDAILAHQGTALVAISVIAVLLVVLSHTMQLLRDWIRAGVVPRILKDIRTALFRRLEQQPLEFFSKTPSSDVTACFDSELVAIEFSLMATLPMIVLLGLQVCINLSLLLAMAWQAALPAVLAMIVCAILPRQLAPKAATALKDAKQRLAETTAAIQEVAQSMSAIKAFGLEDFFLAKVSTLLEAYRKAAGLSMFRSKLIERSATASMWGIDIAVTLAVAYLAYIGRVTIGEFLAFRLLFSGVSLAVGSINWIVPSFVEASASMDQLERIIGLDSILPDEQEYRQVDGLKGSVEFRNVSFAYEPSRTILDGCSFSVKPGQLVALVGESGSGKSTATNLLMRFLDQTDGAILFDGIDHRSMTMGSLRRHVALVAQQSVIFDGTIAENIRLGRLDAASADIIAAAKAARLHEMIESLPDGYDTVVGTRGIRLSGGQTQRLAIARALVRDPAVLVLDEATSALDAENEKAINQLIEDMKGSKTIISVTHRLASVVNADLICVFQRGRVVEMGSWTSLMEGEGPFFRLWSHQNGVSLTDDGRGVVIVAAWLRRIPLFGGLADQLVDVLSAACSIEQFAANTVVFEEGDQASKFYMIIRGEVAVSRRGRSEPLDVWTDGDYFGELSLVKGTPRSATVRTVSPTTFATISQTGFRLLMSETETIGKAFQQRLQEYQEKDPAFLAY